MSPLRTADHAGVRICTRFVAELAFNKMKLDRSVLLQALCELSELVICYDMLLSCKIVKFADVIEESESPRYPVFD